MIRSITHPTDFSPEGEAAFAHALALAMVGKARFDLLHVGAARPGKADWDKFPHVREKLEEWGHLPPGSASGDVADKLGIAVRKVELKQDDPSEALASYVFDHLPDLVVMASSARSGLARLLAGSVAGDLARATLAPTLLFGREARGFVDPASGAVRIGRVLVPVDHSPDAQDVIPVLQSLLEGTGAVLDFLHCGTSAPQLLGADGTPLSVRLIDAGAVDGILAESDEASLIAMPTKGRQGLLDALRGSTTERVLAEARVPVLALPVG